jgi:hypothetical protein
MTGDLLNSTVPEDTTKLVFLEQRNGEVDTRRIIEALKLDLVVLIPGLQAEQADALINNVCRMLGLRDTLELQAGFAGFLGHRHQVSRYFMSVNKRSDYQFVAPHSEGSSFVGMQLASFFCYENSTNGGETILLNTDDSGRAWHYLREKLMRGRLANRPLARHEIARARGLYQLDLPADVLRRDDRILQELETEIVGLRAVEVLAKPKKTYSHILERPLNVYWDSVASPDFDSASEFAELLKRSNLLREPPRCVERSELDSDSDRRVWHSGLKYTEIFKCKITRKLAPGDLLIQNNLTWAHGVSNWSPGFGTRNISAAFA